MYSSLKILILTSLSAVYCLECGPEVSRTPAEETECQELCSKFAPKTQFKGLSIYHLFSWTWTNKTLKLDNKQMECRDADIVVDPKSGRVVLKYAYPNITYPGLSDITISRFGICHKQGLAYDCFYRKGSDSGSSEFTCIIVERDTGSANISRTYGNKFSKEMTLFVKPHASQECTDKMLAIDRTDASNALLLTFKDLPPVNGKIRNVDITFTMCKSISENDTQCPRLEFFTQMKTELFKAIDSVVDYRIGGKIGYIMTFNINNQPFYCSQPQNQNLSIECSTEENLRPLIDSSLDHCYPSPETDSTLWIVIAVAISIVILIICIVIIIVCLTRKTEGFTSNSAKSTTMQSKTTNSENRTSFSKAFAPQKKK